MNEQSSDIKPSSEDAPVIEGFRVIEKLGHGATSTVWKAEQVSLNRMVVIKVLSERLSRDPEDVKLFKAEAQLAANFKHAGIVQVYDFGQSKISQRYYFVMEYVSGYSVGEWVRRKGKITEAEALVIAHNVADALKYAWDLSKIVHCDIKPDNIMVDGDGSIKIADLGLAHTVKTIGSQSGANKVEIVITGTPNYMAPEQVRGMATIDCRADIYALGASLYHMVTGQLPFGDSPPDVVLERQLHEDFEYPQKVNPDLSTAIARLIVKMTAKDPASRFQNWDEALKEIKRQDRQMRQNAIASASPASAGAPAAKSAVSNPPKSGILAAGNSKFCQYCGKPIQPKVAYCGDCGKPASPSAMESVGTKKHDTMRLKPIPAAPTTRSQAVIPPVIRKQQKSNWGGHIRALLSLCLLVFLGYYVYQKVRYNHDVLIPIKAAIIRNVQTIYGRLSVEKGGRGCVLEKPAPEADESMAAQKLTPTDEAEVPTESTIKPVVAESASEATGENVSAKVEIQAPLETPEPKTDTSPEPAKSEPDAVQIKADQDAEYERILKKCVQQQPKVGNPITIRFKNNNKPVEGVLEKVTEGGVMVKIPAGVIEYPFRIMTEESRLPYFPVERARRIQQEKIGRGQ